MEWYMQISGLIQIGVSVCYFEVCAAWKSSCLLAGDIGTDSDSGEAESWTLRIQEGTTSFSTRIVCISIHEMSRTTVAL